MKRLIIVFCMVLFVVLLKAQQTGDYTNYFYKPMLYNPAYTGVQGNINAMAITRIQWVGFTNAPQFNAFTLDGKFSKKKIALGLNIINDKQGLNGRTGGDLLYSYSLVLNRRTRLAFGVSLGMVDNTLNFSKAVVENTNDPVLSTQSQSKITINGSAGIALIGKKIEIGFSVPQLFGNKLKYNTDTGTTGIYSQAAQYLTYVRNKYFINREKGISLSPMALIRYMPHTPFQFNAGLIFDWKKKFSLAAIYKSDYAMAASAGFWIYKRLNVAYSYDFVLGEIAKYSGQTHEILLSYTFGKEESQQDNEADTANATKMKDLNTVLLENLLAQIDLIFEDKNATKEDYRRLIDRITQFSNSHFNDPVLRKLARDYTKKLLELERGSGDIGESIDVTVKGQIGLTGGKKSKSKPDFSDITIQLIDKKTGTLIGLYVPKPRNGKYILVLKPGEKYIIKVEKEGYQTISKEMAPAVRKASYEIKQALKLKKSKSVKPNKYR